MAWCSSKAILQVAQLHIIVPVPKPRLSNAGLRHREGIPQPQPLSRWKQSPCAGVRNTWTIYGIFSSLQMTADSYSTLQREGKGKINNQAKEREKEKETTKINITRWRFQAASGYLRNSPSTNAKL